MRISVLSICVVIQVHVLYTGACAVYSTNSSATFSFSNNMCSENPLLLSETAFLISCFLIVRHTHIVIWMRNIVIPVAKPAMSTGRIMQILNDLHYSNLEKCIVLKLFRGKCIN